jgi:tetratricopeptide (TPR) repeat protein
LAQHRFTEARVIADELVQREPDIPEYRAALGEVAMELGDDATAEKMFRSVWSNRSTLTIGARLARWLEINNHVAEARRLLITSRDDALSRRDVASETKAWFALRVGDLELRSGHLRAAEQAFSLGLDIEPDDPRLLAAMARLAAARHDYRDVIDWGERAIGMQLDPATLGIVGDAYAALGNRSKADEYFKTLQVAVSMQPGAYHRAWSLYLLDHGLQVNDVLQKAQDELRDRKDVYGYDIVAWALEKSGRHAEAKQAMRQALRLRTPDPLLLRHAQVIGVTVDSVGTGA